MIALIVVRHGETDWNRIRRLQGHTDIPLNATGVAQAERLAVALSGEPITAIHASDLARAVATAAPIAARLSLPVSRDPRLRERHYGVLEGLTFPEIAEQMPDEAERLRSRDAGHTIAGGESQRTFHRRVVDAVAAIALAATAAHERADATPTLLLVTHGGVLDMLYRTAFGRPLDAERECPIPNAVVNRIAFDDGRFAVTAWAEAP